MKTGEEIDMSRNRKKPKNHTIRLEKGKFYNVHDGSRSGHPGRIEYADEKKDIYVSTTTGSMTEEEYRKNPYRKNHIELTHTTDKTVYKSFINEKPFKGNRDDYGDKHYPDMKYHQDDLKTVEKVKKKNPRLGFWFRENNKKKKPSKKAAR